MAQVIERVKTFFIMLTRNDNIEMLDNSNIENAVKAIKAQESGNIEKMEKSIQSVNIPLDDKLNIEKVKVEESIAKEQADKKQRAGKVKDTQRE